MAKVGFIGLGRMGAGMTRNLLRHGHALALFDASADARRPFEGTGARIAESPREAAIDAEFVVTMLPDSKVVCDVVLGADGAIEGMSPGCMLIDMSTGRLADVLSLAEEVRRCGFTFVDAPVGRTPWDADAGTLLILAGGRVEDVERATPVLSAMGDEIVHAGPVGSGTKLKLVNNYLTVAGSALAAETLALGAKAGLQRDLLMKVLRSTVAGKGPLNVLYPKKVLAGDVTPLFSGRLAHKDLVLALELGNAVGSPLAMGGAARELYALANAHGRFDEDITALLLVLEQISLPSAPHTPPARSAPSP